MVVGEVGAGRGYFTFRLASRVGPTGKVYANDIDEEGLGHLRNRAAERHLTNIATIVGRVDDPMLPKGQLDMVVMVNTFHDLAKPVELLAALVPCLKPGGKVVILDYDDDKAAKQIEYYGHFNTVTKTLDILAASAFKVDRVDTDFVREVLIVLSVKTAG
jgi:ubiquinone/menaquinone biosynthesis C-methylase UbiE